jgi:hypothetical protein
MDGSFELFNYSVKLTGIPIACGGWLVSPATPGRIEKFHQLIDS